MRLILILIAATLCSCATQSSFTVTAKGKDAVEFQSEYRPYNVHGGRSVYIFAHEAREHAADSAIQQSRQDGRSVESITLTSGHHRYSASGYYTFNVKGIMVYGVPPSGDLIITDRTGMLGVAKEAGERNLGISLILSPGISAINDSAIGTPTPSKYRFRNTGSPY